MQNNNNDNTKLIPEYRAFLQGKVVAICEAVIKEEMGIIAASRLLDSLAFDLVGDNTHEDFVTFTAISSETDHLPVDYDRRNWNAEALKEKDQEILETEAFYRDVVIKQCKYLIKKYGMAFNN